MAGPLLRVENLSKNFDLLPVLKDVSFSIQRGEVIGLVGRQGAGKSTLFHILSGAIPPSTGSINLTGRRVVFQTACRRKNLALRLSSKPQV